MSKIIQNTKAVINIIMHIFLLCIIANLNPCAVNPRSPFSYPYFGRILKYDDIGFR